ncbi:MAG: HPr family phosphocarrier protein [Clostridia bacterium]|nr:HPr family phosphocarrier protein [Clostridia bacterium]MDD4048288.1 HPr family phosphocarrier protein [Clostridia bacterium]
MLEEKFVIQNKTGLHARPASLFVKKASSFKSSVKLIKDDNEIDAKSMLSVLTLGAGQGSTIKIVTDGEDEQDAMNELIKLLQDVED